MEAKASGELYVSLCSRLVPLAREERLSQTHFFINTDSLSDVGFIIAGPWGREICEWTRTPRGVGREVKLTCPSTPLVNH